MTFEASKISDLKKFFCLEELDSQEFLVILNNRSSTYKFIKKGKQTEIKFGEKGHEFSVFLDKNDKCIDVQLGVNAEGVKLKLIQDDIRKALSKKGEKVYRSVIFSDKPLRKAIVSDSFRLLPMPPQAPKLDFILGKHPFIMEIAYSASENQFVNGHRAYNKTEEYVLLLNLLFNSKISFLVGEYKATFHWVLNKITGNVEYSQEMYNFDGFQKYADNFTVVKATDLEVVIEPDVSKYYSLIRASFEDLHPSSEFENDVKKYERLLDEERLKFQTSLKWFYKINFILPFSWSMAMLCLANAIQILAAEKVVKGTCGECKRDLVEKGDGKLFKEFLLKYAKGVKRELIDDFYGDYRSKIAHGRILKSDQIHGLAQTFNPKAFEDFKTFWHFNNIVKIALINWLDEK